MLPAIKALRRVGLVVAGLLVVTTALCLAGAAPAQPSPPRKWDQWHPTRKTTVVPAVGEAANRIIAGETSLQIIKPLHEAACALPPEVPRPVTCLAMMETAMAKRRGQRDYAIRLAQKALECYEGATLAETPTPHGTCRDQVEVTSFQANITGNLVGVFEDEHSNWLTRDTSPGITFTATVAIHEGAIPLSHLRSIQNKTSDTGIIFYDRPPNFTPWSE